MGAPGPSCVPLDWEPECLVRNYGMVAWRASSFFFLWSMFLNVMGITENDLLTEVEKWKSRWSGDVGEDQNEFNLNSNNEIARNTPIESAPILRVKPKGWFLRRLTSTGKWMARRDHSLVVFAADFRREGKGAHQFSFWWQDFTIGIQ